jgi:hypothetical protein
MIGGKFCRKKGRLKVTVNFGKGGAKDCPAQVEDSLFIGIIDRSGHRSTDFLRRGQFAAGYLNLPEKLEKGLIIQEPDIPAANLHSSKELARFIGPKGYGMSAASFNSENGSGGVIIQYLVIRCHSLTFRRFYQRPAMSHATRALLKGQEQRVDEK